MKEYENFTILPPSASVVDKTMVSSRQQKTLLRTG
jgi:hypothetical protein